MPIVVDGMPASPLSTLFTLSSSSLGYRFTWVPPAAPPGFLMEIRDGPGGEDSPMIFRSYCARHAKPQPHMSGGCC